VIYPLLAGETLRQLLARGRVCTLLLGALPRFIAELHGEGIYFRSLHFGNIVVLDVGSLALIDVADMRFQRGPLNLWKRARNFRHLLRYEKDAQHLRTIGVGTFVDAHCADAGLRGGSRRIVDCLLKRAWLSWSSCRLLVRRILYGLAARP
jgi:hypothetical protein